MATHSHGLLTDLLRDVSRSFYLTLRALPPSIRPQIGLAYLLARTTDTIADTQLVDPGRRLEALDALRGRISGRSRAPLSFGELAARQGSPAERVLLERCEEALEILAGLEPPDRALVRQVLDTITSGQELDLRRFAGASAENPAALNTAEELDDYTYRVAGCVGEFWTRICRLHVFPGAALDDEFLLGNGIRFGKGLQLVNILRDVPGDLRLGRCYLPAGELAAAGLAPRDLQDPANLPRLRPLYNQKLDAAEAHLRAGWGYTNALPWRAARVRLACAWPILIGLDTLRLLRRGNVLDARNRIKVGRSDIKRVVFRSVVRYPLPSVWRKLAR
jgi:farnesyl-diphosphate farnesyltransferase